MKTVLLIDGDTIAYLAAITSEKYIEWGEGDDMVISNNADVAAACRSFDEQVAGMINAHGKVDDYKVALTDSVNFRKAILPTYKSKRGKKPMALGAVRRHAVEQHKAVIKPGLEGDDILGIWSTHPYLIKADRKIIVSIDKDMRCIPGLLSTGDGVVNRITTAAADYFHMIQTLTGDQTDGYAGCPGCGPVAAERWVALGDLPTQSWEHVCQAYAKKSLTEADALVQARVARILRFTDYNFKTQEPILWTPPSSPRPS